MTEVKVLIEGYARKLKKGWIASSTCTLVTYGRKKIIVDPGCNRKLLLKQMKNEKLKPESIDYVFLTHYHLDHTLNAALFTKAKILDGSTIYAGDKEYENSGTIPETPVRILQTPGHADELCSLVVRTSKGTIVVAADNFWWLKGEKQVIDLNRADPFANNMKKLKESRKKILRIADYIIPGHGKMMSV